MLTSPKIVTAIPVRRTFRVVKLVVNGEEFDVTVETTAAK